MAKKEDPHADLFVKMYLDRKLAHKVLFSHRHKADTMIFHEHMIDAWHDKEADKVLIMAFRGSAKSTIAEEAIALRAGFREFTNGLVIGETYDRACERLHSIKHEFESNEKLMALFGPMQGETWNAEELVFANGRRLLAMGHRQALRGIKWRDTRPDAIFCDDLENRQSVETKELQAKTKRWFNTELLPACDPEAFIRVAATPLDTEALAPTLARLEDWKTIVIPICYFDAEGNEVSSWPSRYPMSKVNALRESMALQGLSDDFEREYMCSTVNKETQLFRPDHMKVQPQVRTWQAVYAMFDPARTVKTTSAHTGFACWSWIGSKLVVWDAWGKFLLPNEIVDAIFSCGLDEQLPPVWIGVEEDGLNEFLLQPLRQRQVDIGQSIPFRAMKAPRGKLEFIKGLQPFFRAGEVEFVKDLPELKAQLLGFPSGRIDVPNALAYALKLRPGMPVYGGFSARHVFDGLESVRAAPPWLALNATRGITTAILLQFWEGTLYVLKDWVREGPPLEVLRELASQAQLETGGRKLSFCAAPIHFEQYSNVGLTQAAARIPAQVRRAAAPVKGAGAVSALMQRERHGQPCLRVSSNARWTLNALAGGYARGLKNGIITPEAEDGPYKVLMEGLESFAGLTDVSAFFGDDSEVNYAYTPSGQRYISIRR